MQRSRGELKMNQDPEDGTRFIREIKRLLRLVHRDEYIDPKVECLLGKKAVVSLQETSGL